MFLKTYYAYGAYFAAALASDPAIREICLMNGSEDGPTLFIRVCPPPEIALSSLHDEDRNIVNVEKSH
jgi:hypothetical protein